MCFTPAVSLSTALFEWAVAIYILRRPTFTNKWLAVLLAMLGTYQFTEFMMCVTADIQWTHIGFIAYTLLPITGLYYALRVNGHTVNWAWYIPPLVAIAVSLRTDFIISATCGSVGIAARNLLYENELIMPAATYVLYYFGYILIIIVLLIKHYRRQQSRVPRMLDADIVTAIIVSLVPALILIILVPLTDTRFPSIYCGFSVAFAFAALIAAHLQEKA